MEAKKRINGMISFIFIIVLASALAMAVKGLEITSPLGGFTYNESNIGLNVSGNMTYDSMGYYFGTGNSTEQCANCSNFQTALNLSGGNYTLYAYGSIGNISEIDFASFTVDLPEIVLNNTNITQNTTQNTTQNQTNQTSNVTLPRDFTLVIDTPKAQNYSPNIIGIKVISNVTVDSLSYNIGNMNGSCTNCSILSSNLQFARNSTYTLFAVGTLGNISKRANVTFFVEPHKAYQNWSNYTKPKWNGTKPRYTTGFEKLPQLLEAGNITDAELAGIIRNNYLNPGIINRLIKTGKLGNESIEAILDTQFNPPGIFKKFLGFFGFREESYANLIFENYHVSKNGKIKMVIRDDLDDDYEEKIKIEFDQKKQEMKVEQKIRGIDENGTKFRMEQKSTIKIAKQNGHDRDEDDDNEKKKSSKSEIDEDDSSKSQSKSNGKSSIAAGQQKKNSDEDDEDSKSRSNSKKSEKNSDDSDDEEDDSDDDDEKRKGNSGKGNSKGGKGRD